MPTRPDAVSHLLHGVVLSKAIFSRIGQAVLGHSLPPGNRLVEDPMAALYTTNRTQVRNVLTLLSSDGTVVMVPSRSAFIASPTPKQIIEVFEAGRLLESAKVRCLISRRDAAAFATLGAVVADEEASRGQTEQPAIVRLSG
jgi:DNA-binding GntR family transcriptional regulator